MPEPSFAAEIVIAQRARYERLWGALTKRQHKLASDAIKQIERDLERAEPGSWSAATASATLIQLAEATKGLSARQLALLRRALPAIAMTAKDDVARYLQRLDEHYLGAVQPLKWDTLEWLNGYSRPLLKSRLRIYEKSFARYGAAAVEAIEREVAKAALLGKPWTEAREAVMAIVREQVEGKQWMVDRIVRTECLLPESRITGAVVRTGFRRWYEGPVFEVITKNGRKLTATPNHPVLTRRGWVSAAELNQLDDLVCDGRQKNTSAPGDKHVAHPPTAISELFDTIAAIGIAQRRGGSHPDFHGDGTDRQIDVARSARELRIGGFSPIIEPSCHDLFTPPDRFAPLFCGCCRHLFSAQRSCLCTGSDDDSTLVEPCKDWRLGHTERSSDLIGAFAGNVSLTDFDRWQILCSRMAKQTKAGMGRLGGTASVYATFIDGSVELPPGDACSFGGSHDAVPGDVELDGVIDIRSHWYSGAVYNMTTVHGHYTADGIYTSNCATIYSSTTMAALLEEDDDPDDPMLKKLVATWDKVTGLDSKLLHGQTRRVHELFTDVVRGREFDAPPNRPHDRELIVGWRKSWGDDAAFDRDTMTDTGGERTAG